MNTEAAEWLEEMRRRTRGTKRKREREREVKAGTRLVLWNEGERMSGWRVRRNFGGEIVVPERPRKGR